MSRIPFSQVLRNAKLDIRREYDRLYNLFCLQKVYNGRNSGITLKEFCAIYFEHFPFRGTCVNLDDFDEFYGYCFEVEPADFNLDYLVSFCEYSFNLISYARQISRGELSLAACEAIQFYLHQILLVVEAIGYMANTQDNITDFVPKDQAVISVAEIVEPELSYKVIEYNHHSMKGDLERKKTILVTLGLKLESQRDKMEKANEPLKKDIFGLLNNLNLRHNNTDPGSYYKPYVANLKEEELEQWYDDLYQMLLLAFLELDHLDRKGRIEQLNENLKKK